MALQFPDFSKLSKDKSFGQRLIDLVAGDPDIVSPIGSKIKKRTFGERLGNLFFPGVHEVSSGMDVSEAIPTPTKSDVKGITTPTPIPGTPSPILPTATPEMPLPTPTPVQEWYRNPEIKKADEGNYSTASKAIEKFGQQYRVPVNLMMDLAFAESSLDYNSQPYWYKKDENGNIVERSETKPSGSGWSYTSAGGLFQFTDDTWKDSIRRGYVSKDESRFDPESAAKAAAQWIRDGYLDKWEALGSLGKYYTEDELARYVVK